jgi:hypothetical protein
MTKHRLLRWGLASWILLTATAFAAPPHETPGAIERLTVPEGFLSSYEVASDASMVGRGGTEQIFLVVAPSMDPREGLKRILEAFDRSDLTKQIVGAELGAFAGARVDVDLGIKLRWYVLRVADASVIVRIAHPESYVALDSVTERLLASLQIAPARHPPEVVGQYESRMQFSPSIGGAGPSVFAQSTVWLQADGVVNERGWTGASGAQTGALRGGEIVGRWEMRGDRLLIRYADGLLVNHRVAPFSNGLELLTDSGEKLLWVRKSSP